MIPYVGPNGAQKLWPPQPIYLPYFIYILSNSLCWNLSMDYQPNLCATQTERGWAGGTFLKTAGNKSSDFKLLKMPPWWHHIFAMVAPHFHHGTTTFSWIAISFSGQCPKTWCLNGWRKFLNGICYYSNNHLAPNSPLCSANSRRLPKNPLQNIYSLILVVLRTHHNWKLCNLIQFLRQKRLWKHGRKHGGLFPKVNHIFCHVSTIINQQATWRRHGEQSQCHHFFWEVTVSHPPWWHHVFTMVAPRLCHGGTKFREFKTTLATPAHVQWV